ncbi:MAG: tetratricopeptide repeat protein [Chloroflexi bacterium]|nr:tetratricopeptide repeat protein [Chloroflexota bacterium]
MEDKAYIKRQREKEAINLAMESRWGEAVTVNKEMLESFPNDTDALNRLGRALMELGEYEQAREVYSRTLAIEADNTIARKNIDKLTQLIGSGKTREQGAAHRVAPQLFIEETGKTGVVALKKLAAKDVLARFTPGEQAILAPKGPHLLVVGPSGEYLGEVSLEHSQRLIKMIEGGNKYEAAIASMDGGVRVIIKEVYQHPSQRGRLSFPVKAGEGLRAYVKDSLLRYELEEEDEFMSDEGEYPAEEGAGEKESEMLGEGVSIIEGDVLKALEEEKEEKDENMES